MTSSYHIGKVLEEFSNGSYQLMHNSGKQHQARVNGWRLKPYFSQVFNEKVDLDKVNYLKGATVSCKFCHGSSHMCHSDQQDSDKASFDNDEPLGLIAQDPVLAQHVPCILSMSIGPITRPQLHGHA